MPAVNVLLSGQQLQQRFQDRLRGLSAATPNTLLWQQNSDKVLVIVDSLVTKLLDGWLLCNLDLESDQTGRQTLQFVFFLGAAGNGDGAGAGCTINAATAQATQLAEVWGATLQRILWDGVLDALEVFVEQAAAKHPGTALSIRGFQVSGAGIQATILAGDK